MSSDNPPTPHIEVDDANAAMRKATELGRRLLSVPKKDIDAAIEREKTAKAKRKKRG